MSYTCTHVVRAMTEDETRRTVSVITNEGRTAEHC
jgi:hypothetical protein